MVGRRRSLHVSVQTTKGVESLGTTLVRRRLRAGDRTKSTERDPGEKTSY